MTTLTESQFLSQHPEVWHTYIMAGFRQYRTWLALTMGYQYLPYINFGVARGLNAIGCNATSLPPLPSTAECHVYCMGIGLEVAYWLAQCQRVWTHSITTLKSMALHTLRIRLNLKELFLEQIWNDYSTRGKYHQLSLTNEEFDHLLHKALTVTPQLVEWYAEKTWKTPDTTMSSTYVLSVTDLLQGEILSPPATKPLGWQWLCFKGLLGPVPMEAITPSSHFTLVVPAANEENVTDKVSDAPPS